MINEEEDKLLNDATDNIKFIYVGMLGTCILFISVLLTMGNPKGSLEFALYSFSFAVSCLGIGIRFHQQQKNGLGKGNNRLTHAYMGLCDLGLLSTSIGIFFVLYHIDHWTYLFILFPIIILVILDCWKKILRR